MPWSKTTDVGKSETVVDSKGKSEKKLGQRIVFFIWKKNPGLEGFGFFKV